MSNEYGTAKERVTMLDEPMNFIVTGDHGVDRFIYVEGLGDTPPNLREAWVGARRFWTEHLAGGAGALIAYLNAMGLAAQDPFGTIDDPGESIYVLTREGDNRRPKWRSGLAMVYGERDIPCCEMMALDKERFPSSVPAVFMDFNQGCLTSNRQHVLGFLKERPYLIRTHDPLRPEWKSIREQGLQPGIWVCPIQDMAKGSLWFPGNWEDMYERILGYLQTDPTLWSGEEWLHKIVVQISYDGALILDPTKAEEAGTLLVFSGDQPGSFLRKGYGPVIGGGIVFVASLCRVISGSRKLDECVKEGLAWARMVVEEGYTGPVERSEEWHLDQPTNLPVPTPDSQGKDAIAVYSLEPPSASWQTVCDILCGDEATLRGATVFSMGKLITACPDYSRTLLRLSGRLENHEKQGKGILSFTIFGGPGSGKSFVAKQLAAAADPDGATFEEQAFNISQLGSPARLVDALQQIQAIGLRNRIPFVLWDEFDTSHGGNRGGWLPYFLMPMQDARFFDGTSERALGKCVFAFVGGTFNNEEQFKEWALDSPEGKFLKGIDFHSRLDSSLTVPPVELAGPIDQLWESADPAKLVRAIMLRTFLRKHKKLRYISNDVLAYLVHVPLEHGVRSLQRIIQASELAATHVYQSFHLPPSDVLSLHVKELKHGTANPVADFLAQLNGYDTHAEPELLEMR